jgi:hypothetical protein
MSSPAWVRRNNDKTVSLVRKSHKSIEDNLEMVNMSEEKYCCESVSREKKLNAITSINNVL